jgi:coenzyme F420-reducing hydrogenase beta subunit
MKEDREGFLQPKIDRKTCIKCHKCEKTCPILNKETVQNGVETKAYAAINKDEEIRKKSTSGGVFHALAKWTIERGGVVFGARFDEKWEVIHDYSETMEGVVPFMGSKYVQSRIGDSYKQAKSFLEQGRWVLFSGTPCQLGGLRAFLGKEYEKLIQVDLICFGVPSPGVWRAYLKEYILSNGQINSISFRDKKDGWLHSRMVIANKSACKGENEEAFMRGFSKEVYLRKCCNQCQYRVYHRNSDLTIADYWGVDRLCDEMFDDKGTSIVFCHSNMGEQLLNGLSENLILVGQSKDNAIAYNPYMENQHAKEVKRTRFFRMYRLTSSFNKSAFVIDKDGFSTRVVRKLNKCLKS